MCSRPVGRIPLTTLFFFVSAPVANLSAPLLWALSALCDLCVKFFLFFFSLSQPLSPISLLLFSGPPALSVISVSNSFFSFFLCLSSCRQSLCSSSLGPQRSL